MHDAVNDYGEYYLIITIDCPDPILAHPAAVGRALWTAITTTFKFKSLRY